MIPHTTGNFWRDHRQEYQCWRDMMIRCYSEGTKSYKDYGARGIRVCKRWHKIENFMHDMAPRPAGLTLHRLNNDGNYCKRNCKWADRLEQASDNRGCFKKGHKPTFVWPKGIRPTHLPMKHSELSRKKMSDSATLRGADKVWCEAHSARMKGRKMSKATKKKMAVSGRLAWAKGRHK